MSIDSIADEGNLTSRQVEIAQLVAYGLRNGEIASQLELSGEVAVGVRIWQISLKLGTTHRSQIAIYAMKHYGNLPPPNSRPVIHPAEEAITLGNTFLDDIINWYRPYNKFSLTAREKKVIECAATHFSVKQISNELRLSVNTVTNHLQYIYDKTGIHNLTGLTVYGFLNENGYFQAPVRRNEPTLQSR